MNILADFQIRICASLSVCSSSSSVVICCSRRYDSGYNRYNSGTQINAIEQQRNQVKNVPEFIQKTIEILTIYERRF